VSEVGKTRRYDATARRAAAERTRRRVLVAAHSLFTTQGYAETSVAQIARRARVSVDTVYAAVGRKPHLLLAAHDMVLAGGPEPVAAEDRDYVRAVREAPTARAKIETYASALGRVLVGATVVGPAGGEIMSVLALAVHAEVPLPTLLHMHFAYPTYHRAIEAVLKDLAEQLGGH